jgi:hypothetical protein
MHGHGLMEPDLIRAVGSQIYGYDSIMRMGTLTSNLSHSSPNRRRQSPPLLLLSRQPAAGAVTSHGGAIVDLA